MPAGTSLVDETTTESHADLLLDALTIRDDR